MLIPYPENITLLCLIFFLMRYDEEGEGESLDSGQRQEEEEEVIIKVFFL